MILNAPAGDYGGYGNSRQIESDGDRCRGIDCRPSPKPDRCRLRLSSYDILC